ncbi:LysR family transcriptional regulator [Cereibacter changlensis JA139]|uniref:LysR family transcriptional regulator n=2 Tax=Cereibacter changlensis TaxID=402884 RepID=A0A2T4JUR3_9RHOB|nr:LysR family transcriptional regulator [Cereibacter changlensis]PTE21616.1 LysR family transcriptional regulator [Cereibacter changlensis JA139]PZX56132.1 DNA-binding transcriptional LysR family regulator [Cereibacter changlensis]
MEVKWLEDFVTLAETASFSRAAEARHVTQSAFSRRIKQLEAWLGATLISRATMPAELTPAGRALLPVAQDTIRTFYALRESLRPAGESGLVRFAALHTLTVTFFPCWLQRLEADPAGFATSLIADRGGIEANLEALISNEADFFLTYAHPEVPFHLDTTRFQGLTIGQDRLMPLAAPEVRIMGQPHRGQGLLDRALREKLTLPVLSYGYSSFFGVALGRLFARRPPFRHRTLHENSISAGLMNLAVTGAGLCWLPSSLARDEIAAGRLVAASNDPGWELDLDVRLYRNVERRGRAVEALWRAAVQSSGKPEPVQPLLA